MSNSHETNQRLAPEKVGIFISYSRADAPIANALRQSLLAISKEFAPFIDHVGLRAGDEYETKIAQFIKESQWFLMICSGLPQVEKDISWCLYEMGQFRGKLVGEGNQNLISSRIVALYDNEMPRQLAKFLSVAIGAKDLDSRILDLKADKPGAEFENTAVYAFFETLIKKSREQPLCDLTDGDVRSSLREYARDVIEEFLKAQMLQKLPEVVFQPRISFLLPAPSNNVISKLAFDIPVTGDSDSLRQIFGIAGTETTWGKIKDCSKDEDGNDPLWVDEIETAAEQASRDMVPDQPSGLCLAKADGKFYEVLFARYEPFRSGARICYIVFVPKKPRRFDIKQRTSILLATLILSIRFRQRILPFIESVKEISKKEEKRDWLRNLERELDDIESEAQEFGLTTPKTVNDDPLIVTLFRGGDNKTFVLESIRSWQDSRLKLAAAFKAVRQNGHNADPMQAGVKGAKLAVTELKKFQQNNAKFIQVLTEELLYVEKIGQYADRT